MVCYDDSVICVAKTSITGDSTCLLSSLRCDGNEDCVDGSDELGCRDKALFSAGVQALIVIAVIVVLILVPVIYVCVQKKRGKPVVPDCMKPCVSRMGGCCKGKRSGADSSAQQLASSSHGNVSAIEDKDGFTNVAFDTSNGYHSPVRASGHPPRGFKKSPHDQDDHQPSYREWQANRLQQPLPYDSYAGSQDRIDNPAYSPPHYEHVSSHSQPPATSVTRPAGGGRVPANAVVSSGPVRYMPSTSRPAEDSSQSRYHRPYTIASPDGKAKYEARSHLQHTSAAPWDRSSEHSSRPYNEPSIYSSSNYSRGVDNRYGADNNSGGFYGNQSSNRSSGVPPDQLRAALERVHNSPSQAGYYQGYSSHTVDDTVV